MSGVYLVDEYGNPINATNPLPSSATITTGDIEIGAVELKDATTSARAVIDATYGLSVDVKRLADGLDATQGAKADAAVQDASSSASLVSLLKGLQAILGLVTASPTSNTVNDRLKTLNTSIVALEALVGEVQASPTSNTALDRLKVINTSLVALEALIGEVQASPTSNTLLDRLKTINTTLAAATPAGSAIIGKVGIDQTTPGTTNAVDTELLAATAMADATANPTITQIASYLLGFNGTTWDRLQVDASKNLKVLINGAIAAGTNVIGHVYADRIGQGLSSTDGTSNTISALGDDLGTPRITGAAMFASNGTTYDRMRNNQEITLLSSSARTSTTSSSDTVNYNAKGIYVVFDVTAGSTLLLTLTIDMKDSLSGKYVTLLTGASVTGVSTNIYKIFPGIVAATNVAVNDALPRTFRVTITHGNATSCTYSVGGSLIL